MVHYAVEVAVCISVLRFKHMHTSSIRAFVPIFILYFFIKLVNTYTTWGQLTYPIGKVVTLE